MANALNLPLPVPVSEGGTNATTQTNNGVAFYNGTSITTSTNLTTLAPPLSNTNAALSFGAAYVPGNFINIGTAGRNIGVTNAANNPLFFSYNLDYNLTAPNADQFFYNAAASTAASLIQLDNTGVTLQIAPAGTAGNVATPVTVLKTVVNGTTGNVQMPALTAASVATQGTNTAASQIMLADSANNLVTGGIALGGPNVIVAGDYGANPWQRQTSFTFNSFAITSTADGVGWLQSFTNPASVTVSQALASDALTNVPTATQAGYATQASLEITSASTITPAATDFAVLVWPIEGYDFVALHQNSMTFSIWLNSSQTGNFSIYFFTIDSTQAYVVDCTITSANTWNKYTFPIVNNYTGTLSHLFSTVGLGLQVALVISAGSSVTQITPGSWNTVTPSEQPFVSTTGQANLFANPGATLYVALPKLEQGLIATPYPFQSEQQILAKCQRYYQKSYNVAGTSTAYPGTATSAGAVEIDFPSSSNTKISAPVIFPTTMIAIPSVNLYDIAGNAGFVTVSSGSGTVSGNVGNMGTGGVNVFVNAGVTTTSLLEFQYTADISFF